jgi:CRISPR/Cas system-associated exonuclease Cas4 (RecB family)
MESIPIKFDEKSLTIKPDESLGLGNKHTPDFMIMNPVLVIGEIKTGDALKQFHLTTIAGYAMAYESEYKTNIDFGVVYFLETHTPQMNFAQSYVFLIDDSLRKQFIIARDSLYALLQKDTHCIYCPYYATCYPNS